MQPNHSVKNVNTITLVCVCDEHYLILLAALIKSIEINHSTSEYLQFCIIEDSVSDKSKRKLLNSINKEKSTLHFVKMKECVPSNLKLPVDSSSYPLNIYMRLFIPYFLPEDIERAIYLDVDMILQKDVSLLWNQDIGRNIIAAVQDPWVKVVSRWGGVENYTDFGLQEDTKYFNTGLLIMDLKKWRNEDITSKVIDCVSSNKKFAHFPDQYGLNVVLANSWFELNPLWNCFAYHEGEQPYLIHFTGRKPIYKSYNHKQEFKKVFYDYLHLTEWKKSKPIGEVNRYFKKLTNVFDKFMLSFQTS